MTQTQYTHTSTFFKRLLSEDSSVRTTAHKSLLLHIRKHPAVANEKVWKVIYWNYWKADGDLVQQRQAQRLVDVLEQLEGEDKLSYLKGFWLCMSNEWQGIDRLRLDKFYALLRAFYSAQLPLLQTEEAVTLLRQIGPLNENIDTVPIAITLHFIETLYEYIEKDTLNENDYSILHKAIIDLYFQRKSKGVNNRIDDCVFKVIRGIEEPAEWIKEVLSYYEAKKTESLQQHLAAQMPTRIKNTKQVTQLKKKQKKSKDMKKAEKFQIDKANF